jgi:hypothetical protein
MRAAHSSQDRCRTRSVLTIAHTFISYNDRSNDFVASESVVSFRKGFDSVNSTRGERGGALGSGFTIAEFGLRALTVIIGRRIDSQLEPVVSPAHAGRCRPLKSTGHLERCHKEVAAGQIRAEWKSRA